MDDVFFVRLTQHKVAMIDAIDAPMILSYKWYAHKSSYNYYACRKVGKRGKQRRVWMHRVIANAKDGEQVHHKDANTLNNRRTNLERCTERKNLSYRKWGRNNVDSAIS